MSKESINKITGLAIYKAREGKMTHTKLSEQLESFGISLSIDTLQRYESGRINIPSVNLFIIAHILGMDMNELYNEIRSIIKAD